MGTYSIFPSGYSHLSAHLHLYMCDIVFVCMSADICIYADMEDSYRSQGQILGITHYSSN